MIERLDVKDLEENETQILAKARRLQDRPLGQDAPPCCFDSIVNTERLPEGHPIVKKGARQMQGCPFASTAPLESAASKCYASDDSQDRRRSSLPTTPETNRHMEDESFQKTSGSRSVSPSPPIPNSVSKCPIRMLDERPPEAIAEFFESHKHEIPRSHEVCIKRYQSNAESIRRLDAKYGNLANMIQGLGMKHQPMLPEKDEESRHRILSGGHDAIEEWAAKFPLRSEAERPIVNQESNEDQRKSHFDRPLREVRLGESPSRPWGIKIPEKDIAASAVSPNIDKGTSNHKRQSSRLRPEHDPGPFFPDQAHAPRNQSSQMIFTGPVFIGYPPEEAVTMSKQLRTSD